VRRSSPRGCSGAGMVEVRCPLRAGGRRSGGRGQRWCSGLGALGERKEVQNGMVTS
jgi:hypothetical protein